MKRIYTFLTMFMLALMPAMMTSCDTDDWYDDYDWFNDPYNEGSDDLISMARTLNGTWTGDAKSDYINKNGECSTDYFYVEFTFTQYTSYSCNGTGYETDSDDTGYSEVRRFKWYIDPRTGNINIEYISSKSRYVLDANGNSDTSGFFLGWDSKEKQDLFNGVMEGINVDEYITFDCERVTSRSTRALGSDSVQTTSQGKSYGKGFTLKRVENNVPKTLRRR
ncbi:hypothetical protein [Prevotella sp.]|uniref:hypothetical protein n=1 Tax=Prevotella sp. TaxID=59823 RepID=UPI0025F36A13|nr:hypothetical protein [Prevotella sp.]